MKDQGCQEDAVLHTLVARSCFIQCCSEAVHVLRLATDCIHRVHISMFFCYPSFPVNHEK